MTLLLTIYTVVFDISLILGIVVIALVWLFHILGTTYSWRKFHRRQPNTHVKELPGVSIIKPLTCCDANLEQNLETFFRMRYPRYEILFCVQEHNEELVTLIQRLRTKYPYVKSDLFIGSIDSTTNNDSSASPTKTIKNPKIANMLPAYENAEYPLILISDSGIMMRDDTLYEMVTCMWDDVGLVHQMPFSCDKPGFAGTLEKVYFGTQHARMYMAINFLGINCMTGMSCLVRKQCIDCIGGLRVFGDYIAEDFYIAYEISKQGWKLRVAPTPALQNSGDYSIRRWVDRMIRWSKLRMRLSPAAYIEPLQECFLSGIVTGLIANYLFHWDALVIIACHVLVWFLMDYTILRIAQGSSLPFSKHEFAVAWLTRELCSYYVYIKALTGSSIVKWRGRSYRLGAGTRAEEIISPSSSITISKPPVPTLHIESPTNSDLPMISEILSVV